MSDPFVLVLHGARRDLSRRMVLPALATLRQRRLLPEEWALIGTGRTVISDQEFRDLIGKASQDARVARHAAFAPEVGTSGPDDVGSRIAQARAELASATGRRPGDVVVVHYLAVPPGVFVPITKALADQGLVGGPTDTVRVVYEKPYGVSPESFRELDTQVHRVLAEEQVFRIDHFLGKEATQNLHVLRFGNELFASVWNRHHVAQVQIDVPETLDVAQRAEFYDATGAALDMVVSHLFQVAAEVAMEPPGSLEHLTAAREQTLACFRPLAPDEVVLGQFEGYRQIGGVRPDSATDTFIAARLWIDNDRWRGVPFLLRTGKRMAVSRQRVTLVLRRDPRCLYGDQVPPGRIAVSLAGDGAIELTSAVKLPGPELALAEGTARLDLDDVAGGEPLPPYASLLHDVLIGDRTLFTTPQGLAHAWRAFESLLESRPGVLPYAAGSWGPQAALELPGPTGWLR